MKHFLLFYEVGPDYMEKLHKRGSLGERIIALDHLEYRVWSQYVLSADDYGVMRATASVLRADNPRLEREPLRRIEQAMAAVLRSTLVARFIHQGTAYWWQLDWQDFQQIRYPRETVNPAPSPDTLATATVATQKLFALRAVPPRQRLRKVSETVTETITETVSEMVTETVSETPPIPTRAGGRETLTLTPTPALALGEESARETPRPLIDGRAHLLHGQHAWCSWPARDGLCVPAFLHREFIGKLDNPPDADARLRAWYPTVVAQYAGQVIGDDALRFWRHAFALWVGVVTTGSRTPTDRASRTAAAADEVIALVRQGGPS